MTGVTTSSAVEEAESRQGAGGWQLGAGHTRFSAQSHRIYLMDGDIVVSPLLASALFWCVRHALATGYARLFPLLPLDGSPVDSMHRDHRLGGPHAFLKLDTGRTEVLRPHSIRFCSSRTPRGRRGSAAHGGE